MIDIQALNSPNFSVVQSFPSRERAGCVLYVSVFSPIAAAVRRVLIASPTWPQANNFEKLLENFIPAESIETGRISCPR